MTALLPFLPHQSPLYFIMANSLEKTLMLGKIEGRRRRDNRGGDGWMASPTQWTWVWMNSATATAKSLQSRPTLCDPIDGSPPSPPVPGILQARTLEWVAISFSDAWKWKVKIKSLSRIWLLATPWTAAYQAPPSMGFSRQEYWSGVPLPSSWVNPRRWWRTGKPGMLQSMGLQSPTQLNNWTTKVYKMWKY